MAGSELYPADKSLSGSVTYDGHPLLDGNIKAKTPLNNVLKSLSDVSVAFDKAISLTKVNQEYPVYEDFANYSGKDKMAELFNRLGAAVTELNKSVGEISTYLEDGDESISSALYKSKVNADDQEGGYLSDSLITEQAGAMQVVDNNKLTFKGFVPSGSVVFVSKGSLSYFDNSGKGKAESPFWGWALANGQNGTDNLMKGKHLKIAGDIVDAGKEEGRASGSINIRNIESFDIPVTGTVNNSLTTTQKVITKLKKMLIGATSSNLKTVYGPNGADGEDSVSSENTNLQHTHGVSLKGAYTNATPVPFDINPVSINLIPIQKINI